MGAEAGEVVRFADKRTSSGAEKPQAMQPVTESAEQMASRLADEAVDRALRSLRSFMVKMTNGQEPRADEAKQATFAIGLIADRNATEVETRLRWLEHSWIWRLFHRGQKPKRT